MANDIGNPNKPTPDASGDCFVIMPISEVDGYPSDHFQRVYLDIISPACDRAGFNPVRADDVKSTNFIHLDIIQKIIASPIAVCDLSTRNPNVMFELGIRQAFDKPVVLMQEIGTPKIFDISPIRCLEYSRDMRYNDVVQTQVKLSEVIQETMSSSSDPSNVNSIVRLLSLSSPASIPELGDRKLDMELDVLRSQIGDMSNSVDKILKYLISNQVRDSLSSVETWTIKDKNRFHGVLESRGVDNSNATTNVDEFDKVIYSELGLSSKDHKISVNLDGAVDQMIADAGRARRRRRSQF